MAGYVKLQRSIWNDADFLALSAEDQRTYMLLISQADISHVGVLPLTPGRWSRLAAGSTPGRIRASLDRLASAQFILTDPDTEELLVRSYIVHDEAHKLTNGTKSLQMAYDRVMSPRLRSVIVTILTTVDVRVDSTVESSQQPAAKPSSHKPAASSRTGRASEASSPDTTTTAAAALESFIDYRQGEVQPGNVAGFRKSLRSDERRVRGPKLDAYTAEHPDATVDEVLGAVFGLTEMQLYVLNKQRKGA